MCFPPYFLNETPEQESECASVEEVLVDKESVQQTLYGFVNILFEVEIRHVVLCLDIQESNAKIALGGFSLALCCWS